MALSMQYLTELGMEETQAEELLGMRLAVMHNLWFYNHLMERIRDELDAGTFTAFHDRYVKLLDTRI